MGPTHSYVPSPHFPTLWHRLPQRRTRPTGPARPSHFLTFPHTLCHPSGRLAQPTPHTYPHFTTLCTSPRREAGLARLENDDEWAGRLWREMQGRRRAAAQAQAAGEGGEGAGDECEGKVWGDDGGRGRLGWWPAATQEQAAVDPRSIVPLHHAHMCMHAHRFLRALRRCREDEAAAAATAAASTRRR